MGNGRFNLVQLFLQIHVGNSWAERCDVHAFDVTFVLLELGQSGLVIVVTLKAIWKAENTLLLLNNLSGGLALGVKHGLVGSQIVDGHLILGNGFECLHLSIANLHVPICLV